MTLSPAARRQIETLRQEQPETKPWLAVLTAALEAASERVWEKAAAGTSLMAERTATMPLLAGAQIPLAERDAAGWVRRVLSLAGEAAPASRALRNAAKSGSLEATGLLEAAINADERRQSVIADRLDVDPDALMAVATVATMPLLQALRRRFAGAIDPSWDEGYCPVCGGWPLLAEQRGLERVRRLRCGRCGGDWAQPGTRCPYCDATGHSARSALVPEQDGESRRVETCGQCLGYLKSAATLRAWEGDDVALVDLATIDLDLAALEREYMRPRPRPLVPGVTLTRVEKSRCRAVEEGTARRPETPSPHHPMTLSPMT
jgi:FdhE protein